MNICDECETVSHCMKNGCVPKQAKQPLTEVQQIAEALRQIGLTLVKTKTGYHVIKLHDMNAQKEEPKCKVHPDAPHGFLRNASHSEGRYVCECEFWEP